MAGLCAVGGVTGFYLKGSKPSLFGGLAIGALYGASGYLLKQNANWGIELALFSSVLLAGGMLPRALKVQKPLPITLVILGTLNTAYYSRKYLEFM
jgi:uncharacterized membrane protein (UPF0136 family)